MYLLKSCVLVTCYRKKTATRASAFSQDFICFTLLLLVISFFSSNRVNIY